MFPCRAAPRLCAAQLQFFEAGLLAAQIFFKGLPIILIGLMAEGRDQAVRFIQFEFKFLDFVHGLVHFVVDPIGEAFAPQDKPVAHRGRGDGQAGFNFLAGKTVAGMQPERILLRLRQIYAGILRPEFIAERDFVVFGEGMSLRLGRNLRQLVGQDFPAPGLAAVMINEKLIGFPPQKRKRMDMFFLKMKKDMPPEILKKIFRVLPLPRQAVEIIAEINLIIVYRARYRREPPFKGRIFDPLMRWGDILIVHGFLGKIRNLGVRHAAPNAFHMKFYKSLPRSDGRFSGDRSDVGLILSRD